MNVKSFLVGFAVGAVSGFIAKEMVDQYACLSPERVLSQAKAKFKELGPISGSWIQMKKEPYVKEQLTYDIYRGGVSRLVDHKLEQYEFVADAKTGTILDVVRIS